MKQSKTGDVVTTLQDRIRTFSRIEKAFYLVMIITALTMAISVVYLQSRLLQVQQEITQINHDINLTKTDLNNAKQEVNEMLRLEKITKLAKDVGLSPQYNNVEKVD